MSEAYMRLLVNTVWTPHVELWPINMAIREELLEEITVWSDSAELHDPKPPKMC